MLGLYKPWLGVGTTLIAQNTENVHLKARKVRYENASQARMMERMDWTPEIPSKAESRQLSQ